MDDGALLAIDLGTTRLKVAAFAPDGRLLELAAKHHVEHREGPRVWQSADAWWDDSVELVRRVAHGRELLGISLSGRGGAGVFVDAAGRVVEDPWSDGRQRDELRDLRARGYAAALIARTLWLRKHAPERFANVRHALYAKDFLLYRLTGLAVTDQTSGPDAPEWDAELLARADLDPKLLSAPALPWELAGSLTPSAAEELGCRAGTPVAVGGHDGICANVGADAGEPGAYAITLGTHGVVRAITRECPEGAERFYGLPPDRHVIGGNALMAGRALEWLAALWGGAELGALDALAARIPVGSAGVRFLPFLGGRRHPVRRPEVSASLSGLRLEHGRPEIWRAALEGTAFAIGEIFRQVRGWCGPPEVVRLTGGGAQSEVWSQILADVLDQPLETTDAAVESRGAAIFLAVALDLFTDVDSAAKAMVRVGRTYEPDPQRVEAYREVYASWA